MGRLTVLPEPPASCQLRMVCSEVGPQDPSAPQEELESSEEIQAPAWHQQPHGVKTVGSPNSTPSFLLLMGHWERSQRTPQACRARPAVLPESVSQQSG